jgi:hypothetical protein
VHLKATCYTFQEQGSINCIPHKKFSKENAYTSTKFKHTEPQLLAITPIVWKFPCEHYSYVGKILIVACSLHSLHKMNKYCEGHMCLFSLHILPLKLLHVSVSWYQEVNTGSCLINLIFGICKLQYSNPKLNSAACLKKLLIIPKCPDSINIYNIYYKKYFGKL